MEKNFDDFLARMDNRNFSLVAKDLVHKFNDASSPEAAKIATVLEAMVVILREYHNWAQEQP